MDDASKAAQLSSADAAVCLLIGASILVGLAVFDRWRRGLPLLPYRPRREVPWRGLEVLVLFAMFELVGPLLILPLVSHWAGQDLPGPSKAAPAAESGRSDVMHPIVDLLKADPRPSTWLLCGLVAAVTAPIVEEFMYRLLLQGWLEAEERRARRTIPALRRLLPGVGPVVLVSLAFAARHFRVAAVPLAPELLKLLMLFQAVWSLVVLAMGIGLLRTLSGATAADLGWEPRRLLADVRLGLFAFAAVAAPVILLQYVVTEYLLPGSVAADPIPLFFFALVLGTLYYRTHRIAPSIVAHMALNVTSLSLAWLSI
jgi:membrane protease YdiL (CAAX protease family)